MNALSTFFFTSIVEGGDLNLDIDLYYKHQKMSVKLQGSWPLSTQLFLLLSFIFSCQNITFCPFKIRLCSFWSINFFPISF